MRRSPRLLRGKIRRDVVLCMKKQKARRRRREKFGYVLEERVVDDDIVFNMISSMRSKPERGDEGEVLSGASIQEASCNDIMIYFWSILWKTAKRGGNFVWLSKEEFSVSSILIVFIDAKCCQFLLFQGM
jgi:hypothetical protein